MAAVETGIPMVLAACGLDMCGSADAATVCGADRGTRCFACRTHCAA